MKQLIHHPESGDYYVGEFDHFADDNGCNPVDAANLPAHTQIAVGVATSTVLPSMDFETYSEAGYVIDEATGKVRGAGARGKGGLPLVGTPVYASHPSTEILCLYYDLKDGKGRRGWYPGTPNPQDLLDHIANGGLIEAWNATFEFWIWNQVAARRLGWPPLQLEQCRCVMARSRRFSLPGALGTAAQVLGTGEKDKRGKNLLNKLSRPVSATKKRAQPRWTPATAWQDFLDLYAYCDQDVAAEDGAAALIPDLSDTEHAVWQLDQRINVRGVQVDTASLDAMLDILDQATRKYTVELATLTQGAVGSVSEAAKLCDWLTSRGTPTATVDKAFVEEALQLDLPDDVRRVLEIRQLLGSANVKKLHTLALQVNSDGRLRDQYSYCGADRTGRWSAGGVQLQNITAKGPKTRECEACELPFGRHTDSCPRCGAWMLHDLPEWTVEQVEQALTDIATRNLATVEAVWGDPVAVLCGCLRGLFTAREGHDLVCVDFSAIEAVVLACLARCQWRIDVFNGDGKIYEMSAAKITGRTVEEYAAYKADTGMHHPDRKKIGKVAELASGYGGWINAWKAFGADMPDDEIKEAVLAWRDASPEVVDMWGGQYRWCGPGKWDYKPELHGLEGCAILAIQNPGTCYAHHDISYGVSDDILYCMLPSGRFLHYHRPRLHPVEDKLRRGPAVGITYEGYNSNPAMGPVGWCRRETFGGRLAENVTQAVARDIQAEAMLRVEQAGYSIVMHTHDEVTVEVPHGVGSVEHMASIMTQRPDWAQWWPIRGDGWRHKRYQKD